MLIRKLFLSCTIKVYTVLVVVGSQLPSFITCILCTYDTNIHVLVEYIIYLNMTLEVHVRIYEIKVYTKSPLKFCHTYMYTPKYEGVNSENTI